MIQMMWKGRCLPKDNTVRRKRTRSKALMHEKGVRRMYWVIQSNHRRASCQA